MGESQSRYSIIDRLANKKMELIDKELATEEKIAIMKSDLQYMEENMATWEKEALADIERERASKQQQIKSKAAQLAFLEGAKEKELDAITRKISEIDRAIDKIGEVSKLAE